MQSTFKGPTLVTMLATIILSQGCSERTSYPSRDTMTAGIFLDKEPEIFTRAVDVRRINDRGIELTKVSEGFVGHLYNDAAQYCTIAYGHLVKTAPCDGTEPEEFRRGLTVAQGTSLLRKDMGKAERAVTALVSVDITDNQYSALCDFVYNVGSGNFSRSTLRDVINAGEFDRVAYQLNRWVKAGGRELEGLKIRRKKEIELFYEGIAMPRAMPLPGEDASTIDIRLGE